MSKRIFRSFAALIVLAILLTFAAMEYISYQDACANMHSWAEEDAKLLAEYIDEYGTDAINEKTAGIIEGRVTLISEDGTVLFESDEDRSLMENHFERPEVQEAFAAGSGSATRRSQTFGRQSYYYAIKTADGSVVRISRTMDTVMKEVLSRIPVAAALIALLIILELFLAKSVTGRIVAPINALDLVHPLSAAEDEDVYEELEPLLGRIEQQNGQIRAQMEQLKKDQEQYLTITENMQDGLIVTDTKNVLSINKAAQKLFDVTPGECIGHSVITVNRDPEMREAFEKAMSGGYYEKIFERSGRSYQLHAAPVTAGLAAADKEAGRGDGESDSVKTAKKAPAEVYGAVILTMDVTEREQAEIIRREFTANVSHELKTPLMSISGYAELIENGIVKQEDIPEFASRIHAESVRLKNLVEDIIRLSRMEERGAEIKKERSDLSGICEEVIRALLPYADEQQVTLTYAGEIAEADISRQILFEMIYNLCDNAVKYNRPGGRAELLLTAEDGRAKVTVKDNGIGIPREHQARVFERFYRVDKSHSRQTGGTGLGLSIVKHGALLHDAELSMDSVPGRGTVIEILFPKPAQI